MVSYLRTAKKLQTACRKVFKVKILINSKQWFNEDKDTAMTVYTVQVFDVDENGKKTYTELFKTYSQVQLVLFMRDLWYELNGWEVPTDNPRWQEIKEKYGKTHEATAVEPTVSE